MDEIKHIHILSFDIPYPANYGGVIDVYYKLGALAKQGVKIHLHCFEYCREPSQELEKNCHKVWYYPRKRSWPDLLSPEPFIVKSRKNQTLFKRLLADEYPIICEGLHTTALLLDERFKNRHIYVRTHNVEHAYYLGLAKQEKKWWRKFFFLQEALKLKRYEPVLARARQVWAISNHDTAYFKIINPYTYAVFPFHPYDQIKSIPGQGKYIIYHGSLDVGENIQAALYLVKHVFSKLSYPCIVAGKNPPPILKAEIDKHAHCTLIPNPSNSEMDQLIKEAHINLLITFQNTGLKLKLIHALFAGRFVLVNPYMVDGTGLGKACVVAQQLSDIIEKVTELMQQPFDAKDIASRNCFLQAFQNETNAKALLAQMKHNP